MGDSFLTVRMVKRFTGLVIVSLIVSGIFGLGKLLRRSEDPKELVIGEVPEIDKKDTDEIKTATLSMGCFWGPDSLFGGKEGVIRTRVGYAGGEKEDPTYHSLGGHTETIQIDYDPRNISYEEILDIFWRNHNPTSYLSRQYMSIIFYHDAEQKKIIEESKEKVEGDIDGTVMTEIRPYEGFYLAEDYHQKYRLRQYDGLFKAYGMIYEDSEKLIDSAAVAKVNGYVSGHGDIGSKEQLDVLGLSEKGDELVYREWSRSKDKSKDYCDLPPSSEG